MWTCIPSLLGAGLFPYWLGSFAYPRRSKNERNAVTGAICHDERSGFWLDRRLLVNGYDRTSAPSG